MGSCPGCEALPSPLADEGVLFLCPPLGHSLAKLRDVFRAHALSWEEPSPQVMAVDRKAAAGLLDAGFDGVLSRAEMESTRCLLLPSDEQPTISDLAHVESLQSLLARAKGQWLIRLIAEQRLISYFQPIVVSDRPDEVFAYECLLRGAAGKGQLHPPNEMYAVARDAGLLFQLDRAARLRHIRSAVEYGLTTKVFINFNPTAIYDPKFCLRSTVQAISGARLPADRFVFEVVESEAVGDPDRLTRILEYYRENGFLIALDDFGSGYASVSLLARVRPDFIKLDAHLLRNVEADAYKSLITAKLLEMARDLNVRTIAEGIETAEEYHWALRHGADFVQGYLFGRPASVPEAATAGVS